MFFGGDGSQNMFVYQPTRDTLELKKDKSTDYVFRWKSKGLYISKFTPLYTAFLHRIKPACEFKTCLKFAFENKFYLQVYWDNCTYKTVDERIIILVKILLNWWKLDLINDVLQ